jgi:hypothetical protein
MNIAYDHELSSLHIYTRGNDWGWFISCLMKNLSLQGFADLLLALAVLEQGLK